MRRPFGFCGSAGRGGHRSATLRVVSQTYVNFLSPNHDVRNYLHSAEHKLCGREVVVPYGIRLLDYHLGCLRVPYAPQHHSRSPERASITHFLRESFDNARSVAVDFAALGGSLVKSLTSSGMGGRQCVLGLRSPRHRSISCAAASLRNRLSAASG